MQSILRSLKLLCLLCFLYSTAGFAGTCAPPFSIRSGFINLRDMWAWTFEVSIGSDLRGCSPEIQGSYLGSLNYSMHSSLIPITLHADDSGPQVATRAGIGAWPLLDARSPRLSLSFGYVVPDLAAGFPSTLSLTGPFQAEIDVSYFMGNELDNRPFLVDDSRVGSGTMNLNLWLAYVDTPLNTGQPEAHYFFNNGTFTFEAAPEPSALVLFSAGLGCLLLAGRYKAASRARERQRR